MQIQLRWMVHNDLPWVLGIERASFPDPWTFGDFANHFKRGTAFRLVAEVDDVVRGFALYKVESPKRQPRYVLESIAVQPEFRRRMIGTTLVHRLVRAAAGKQSFLGERYELFADVGEYNLDAQLFFRACGMQYVRTLRALGPKQSDVYRFRGVQSNACVEATP